MVLVSDRVSRFFKGSGTGFWLALSLTFAAIYALLAVRQSFGSDYLVQDDARQHVVWMRRFLDSGLFPGDFIADYYQSNQPWGLRVIYEGFARLGVDPLVLNRFLPLLLGVVTAGYCFGISMQVFPVPLAGFLASILLNQSLWMKDTLSAAIASSFSFPLFFAFFYYWLRRSVFLCLITLFLQGLFYPPSVLVSAGTICFQVVGWQDGRLVLSRDRRDYLFCAAGLGVALLVLLPHVLTTSEYGGTISLAEARTMPEFQVNGRVSFFNDNPLLYWFGGRRSGMLPPLLFTPITLVAGLFLPLVRKSPLIKEIKGSIWLFFQLFVVSLGLFLFAHLVLFKLYLPNRYTGLTFHLGIAIATGITLTTILDAVWRWARNNVSALVAMGVTIAIAILTVFYPSLLKRFPQPMYVTGNESAVYEFFQNQPKDILIASLSEEADNIPAFSRRSVLVAWEYALPYQLGYYRTIRQRAIDLIRAQYSPDRTVIANFIDTYGINYFLIDRNAFTPEYFADNHWFKQWNDLAQKAMANSNGSEKLVMVDAIARCSVFKSEKVAIVEAQCIVGETAF